MRIVPSLVLPLFFTAALAVGQTPPNQAVIKQQEAMKKLAFLVGRWSGPATISRGPGNPLQVTQTEEVQYKLDGLLLLIEGSSRDAAGHIVFRALATVSFDEASNTYRFRAYNGGHYLDTEFAISVKGFTWSYDAGPAHIKNAMSLTDKGEWSETTEATVGNNPPRPSVQMLLSHQP
jgi:hypothetical protein